MRDKELKYLHDLLKMKDTMISLLKKKKPNSTMLQPKHQREVISTGIVIQDTC